MPAVSQPVSLSENDDYAQHNPDNFDMAETEQPVTESIPGINALETSTIAATIQLPNTPTCTQPGSFLEPSQSPPQLLSPS